MPVLATPLHIGVAIPDSPGAAASSSSRFIYFNWKGLFPERRRHRNIFSSIGSLPWLELSQSEAWSQELLLGLSLEYRVLELG